MYIKRTFLPALVEGGLRKKYQTFENEFIEIILLPLICFIRM
jgi:hypothetical protein